MRGYSRRDAAFRADRDSEIDACFFRILTERDHERKPQAARLCFGDSSAYEASAAPYHRRERLWRRPIRSDEEIAFVLALRAVDDDEHLPAFRFSYGFRDRGKGFFHTFLSA